MPIYEIRKTTPINSRLYELFLSSPMRSCEFGWMNLQVPWPASPELSAECKSLLSRRAPGMR
eukprot:1162694-Pleurochrysis_carterae.AAC.4